MDVKVQSRWKLLIGNATAATLILLLPFLVFLRFNGYGMKHPEVFICCGLIAVAGMGWGTLTWFMQRHLAKIVMVVFGAMILGTVLQPVGDTIRSHGDFPVVGDPGRPFLWHVILDEYAAPESLDREFDQDGEIATEMNPFFIDHDFTICSRAYSRMVNTAESIPILLNRGTPKSHRPIGTKVFTKAGPWNATTGLSGCGVGAMEFMSCNRTSFGT